MSFKHSLAIMSWDGWYEGRKRPHRNTTIVVSYVPDSSETEVLLIDDSKRFGPGYLAHITRVYRGLEFPRSRILTPDNIPVATSGVAQPEDFVVGNKFVIESGKPPILLRHCQDPDEVILGYQQGDGYQLQPPDIPYDDEGVPEWPPGYDPDIAVIEYMERQKQVPPGSAAAAAAEKARRAAEAIGEGVLGRDGLKNTAAAEGGLGCSEAASAGRAGAGESDPS